MADSGCSKAIYADRYLIFDYQEKELTYETSAGNRAQAIGLGKTVVCFDIGNGNYNELIVDCLYQPGLEYNLFNIYNAKEIYGIYYDTFDDTIRYISDRTIYSFIYARRGVP